MCTQVLYVHCWGGHGRTGSVVCLLLHRLYGLDAASALFRCQFVHDCAETKSSTRLQCERIRMF